jgi:16S rRNA (guanine(527)-N(7))-methyltransferase RsmG
MWNKDCKAYVQEVLKFRKALNLTSVDNEDDFFARFIEPSLAMAERIPEKGRLLDIGSGMGVPGVPLLIAKPDLIGVLVERRKKRAEFLRHVVRTLKLNAEVYDADINHLPSLYVDICVARAVTDEGCLLEMCSPHANQGAVAILPVPRSAEYADVAGWSMKDEYSVSVSSSVGNGNGDGEEQIIRCYHYA